MNVALIQTDSGIVLPVKAQAGARINAVTGEHDGMLKVSVTQAPEKGKANKALAKTIAQQLGLKKSQVCIVSGMTSSMKSFLVSGIELDQLHDLILARLNPSTESD